MYFGCQEYLGQISKIQSSFFLDENYAHVLARFCISGILYLENFAFSDVCLSMLSVAPLPIGAPGPLLTWIKTDMEQVSMVTILRGVIINAG